MYLACSLAPSFGHSNNAALIMGIAGQMDVMQCRTECQVHLGSNVLLHPKVQVIVAVPSQSQDVGR